jgi:hypothetical protein
LFEARIDDAVAELQHGLAVDGDRGRR